MALLQDGEIIRGTYEVERFIGEGAFAEVYRVKHRFLGRQAMKLLKTTGMTVQEIEELLGEAILLSRLGHPNIIRVFDANITETSRGIYGFFTMEFIAGGSLERFWQSFGAQFVPITTTIELIVQVCRGLEVAHSEKPPIIHRDIKPQNILVGYEADGLRARISDFGLAKRVNPLTLLASAKGTRCFKAPEVFKNHQNDSCAGDIWAIGCTLYLLLTDRLPFTEMDELDFIDGKSFERPIIPPSRLNLQVDAVLDQIVCRSLSLNTKERYANAKTMLADLVKWKPKSARNAETPKSSSGYLSKTALGFHSPVDEHQARKMAIQAVKLAKQASKLKDAADLMEEAFNKWPDLREQYEYLLKCWRCGKIG